MLKRTYLADGAMPPWTRTGAPRTSSGWCSTPTGPPSPTTRCPTLLLTALLSLGGVLVVLLAHILGDLAGQLVQLLS